ncbi:hypothetical protein BJF78_33525 [Pseudonocardia sp. CNS-139]|nr:hypothetical protein BJF78_33525 [Pseudonocardia sp. CNS-139]
MAETNDALCIVGDTFGTLAQMGGVQTVSQFVRTLRSGGPVPRTLVAGQGVSAYEIEYLRAALAGTDVEIVTSAVDRVSRHIAHKHRETNVLLADLERTGEQTYAANLRLHADNELLQDHQTGSHVQGIVIVEAFRQMFIAVYEAAHGLRAARSAFVVWDTMDVRFTSFLFPLPARLTCTIVESDVTDPARMAFQVRMDVSQCGVQAAYAGIRFAVYDHDRIRAAEDRRAVRAVAALLSEVSR